MAEEERIGLHNLKPAPGSRKARKRVGRGEGSGTGKTAGRGQKGYGSRSGAKDRARFEGGQMPIHMRLPKLRGFKNRFRTEYQPVNLGAIAEAFADGGTVGVDELVAAGLVRKNELVKVLGDGDISVKLDITAHAFSKSAQEKLTAAGGSATKL